MDDGALSELVRESCLSTCRDFLAGALPDLALERPARYLSSLIGHGLPALRCIDELAVMDSSAPHQLVRLTSKGGDLALIALGVDLDRESARETMDILLSSQARERLLLYLFSFHGRGDEEGIAQAMMEPEILGMVRDTGVIAYFAMLDPRAGMGMLARIDGELRSIQYLPH